METTTKARTFATLDEIHAATTQTSAQQLLNGRICLKDEGWADIELTTELREHVVNEVVALAGGHRQTRERMWRALTYETRQHWALGRMFVEKYNESPARLRYCAGQDYPSEMAQLRAALK